MKSMNDLQKEIYQDAVNSGWHQPDKDASFAERLCLCHSELSEALEEYRKHKPLNEVYYENGKPEGIPVELADVVIRILDMCEKYNINLQAVIEEKMAFNKTRSHRHGNKKI